MPPSINATFNQCQLQSMAINQWQTMANNGNQSMAISGSPNNNTTNGAQWSTQAIGMYQPVTIIRGEASASRALHSLEDGQWSDCSCPNGTSTNITFGQLLTHEYPILSDDTTDTYCKGADCVWSYKIQTPNLLTVINFTLFDISYADSVQLAVDGQDGIAIEDIRTYSYYNAKTIDIHFFSEREPQPEAMFLKGIAFNIGLQEPPVEEINLCNSSLYYFNDDVKDVRKIHLTSCKGRLSLEILDGYDDATLQVYDGSFETGRRMELSDNMMVASGSEMSISVVYSEEDPETKYEFVVSDSFTDKDGIPCGGTTNQTLSTVEGCISCYIGVFARVLVNGPPVPVYKGISTATEDLIPTTDTIPMDIFSSSGFFMITFKIPKGYTGGAYVTHDVINSINIFNSPILIVSKDYIMPDGCSWTCFINEKLNYTGTTGANGIQFELLNNIGNGSLTLNNNTYSSSDNLINVTLPLSSRLLFYSATGENQVGYLLSRAYPVNTPPTTNFVEKSTVPRRRRDTVQLQYDQQLGTTSFIPNYSVSLYTNVIALCISIISTLFLI